MSRRICFSSSFTGIVFDRVNLYSHFEVPGLEPTSSTEHRLAGDLESRMSSNECRLADGFEPGYAPFDFESFRLRSESRVFSRSRDFDRFRRDLSFGVVMCTNKIEFTEFEAFAQKSELSCPLQQ
jgi:hypothetical protein